MNDSTLAEKLTEMGVVHERDGLYYHNISMYGLTADQITRNWNVAGDLLERLHEDGILVTAVWPIDAHDAIEMALLVLDDSQGE